MKRSAIISTVALGVGLAFSACAPAQSLSKAVYDSTRKDIASDYKTARIGCEPMEGNVRDTCVADVRGRHELALAELEVAYSPSGKALEELRLAKARTDHLVAIGKCEDKAGKARDVCLSEAKSRYAGS